MTEPTNPSFWSVVLDQDLPHMIRDIINLGILDLIRIPVLTIILYFTVRYANRRSLWNHEDNKHVSFSLNVIDNGVLELSTLAQETDIEKLFPNVILRDAFTKAVKRARRDSPILEFPPDLERPIMGKIQNMLSLTTRAEFLRSAAGLHTRKQWFVFMAAYEQYEDTPFRKVRIIVTSLDLLNAIPDDDKVNTEEPHQIKRLHTVRLIRDRYNAMPLERQQKHSVRLRFDCRKDEV